MVSEVFCPVGGAVMFFLTCLFSVRFSLGPGVDLSRVLHFCPAALTGADLYALCADAMMSAIKEKVQRLQEGETAAGGLAGGRQRNVDS